MDTPTKPQGSKHCLGDRKSRCTMCKRGKAHNGLGKVEEARKAKKGGERKGKNSHTA